MKRGASADLFSQRGSGGKRRQAARTDRDGDLVMDSAPRTRDRVGKHRGRGGHMRDGVSPNRSRGNLNSAVVQREVLRHIASNEPTSRRPAADTSTARHLKEIRITGWTKSKAATNDDGGVAALVSFIERRGTMNLEKWASARGLVGRSSIKIKKSRVEGDALVIFIPSDEAPSILRLNGYVFAGANIKVEQVSTDAATRPDAPSEGTGGSSSANETKQLFQSVLARRYNADMKLLDLSRLTQDAELNAIGIFDAAVSTQSKFFAALMKICDDQFKSAQEKRDTVHSVTLADNGLASVTPVTTLAQTFPDLKNLDLSNNQLKGLASLEPWKHRFRHLDYLVLTGNPLESNTPDFKTTLMAWYPTLRVLDGIQIRSDEEAAEKQARARKTFPPLRGPNFQDENQIAETFIKSFFAGFDSDRQGLVNLFYDAQSEFSLSVNTKALRDASKQKDFVPQEWDSYIKHSRNLKKIAHLPARMSRSYLGPDRVREIFMAVPATRHPSLVTDPQKWLIECVSQPGVPDPTGQSPTGVGGFLITVHGEFEEMDMATGQARKHRSFDRSFVLGPGGPSGVRVVKEMWTLRAYGGFDAFAEAVQAAQAVPAVPEVPAGLESGRASMVEELSRLTGMRPEYSIQCLEESGWQPEQAMAIFQTARAALPSEAFY